APNHKLTEPWGFLVLGPRTKRAYAETKARLKLGARDDAEKAQKMIDEVMAIPAIVGVTQRLDDDPIRREEDYAAVFMAIQNLLLAATSLGLGTKMHTGEILEDKELRDALQVNDGERIVAFVDVGEPAEELPPKKRVLATERTRWLL
ncbi:MAG TPA: nitroreductase family protein, partial [Longimicrobiales bacterium]|nr:nitroreductase family protein [Longimicrobiales bacterium]